jgi:hypothetical protein
MVRRKAKMTVSIALNVFGITLKDNITKDFIKKRFAKLIFANHPDKNKTINSKKAGEKITQIKEAKQVLLENFESLTIITPDKNRKSNTSIDSTFVDWLKVADAGKVNPFTVYKQGKDND